MKRRIHRRRLILCSFSKIVLGSWVYDPLLLSVRNTTLSGVESFYVGSPRKMQDEEASQWLSNFEDRSKEKPFDRMTFKGFGQNAPVVRYDPDDRNLVINADHPFIDKLSEEGRRQGLAKLFATSESLLEGQLQDHGVDRAVIASLLDDRDRALRLLAGYECTHCSRSHTTPANTQLMTRLRWSAQPGPSSNYWGSATSVWAETRRALTVC